MAGTTGCATKKYVRQQVDPVTGRVQQVETQTTQNTSNISELKSGLSNTDERAQEAQRLAKSAGDSAQQANQGVTRVGQQADQAKQLAESGLTRVAGVERAIENYSNFQLTTTENVLFRLNRSELTKDAKEQLDRMAQNLTSAKRYAVEVQGFADRSGGANYNLSLSERRANSVVRYLTTQHQVPLRNVHVIGVGEVPAPTDGARRSGKDDRRVEVRVFTPTDGAAPTSQTAAPVGF